MRRRVGGLCVAVVAVACAARPFRGDTGIRPFSFDVYDVHCPSGLRVIFERAPGGGASAVTALVGAGGHEDPPGREGLAHLVEHLTFRSRGPNEEPLRARRWAMGADDNAETYLDKTIYHAVAPAEALRALVASEGERLLDPLRGVDEATFAVERDVVRNELRERNETHSMNGAYAAAFQIVFPAEHPYSRPVAGSHQSLSALTLDDARRFVAGHYQPQNITLVMVGDLELGAVEGFVRQALPPALYGDPAHPRPIAAPPAVSAAAPPLAAAVGLARTRAPIPTPEVWIVWSLPGGYGPDRYLAEMWATLANQNFSVGRFGDNDLVDVGMFAEPGLLASIFLCRVRLTEGNHPEESLRQVLAALPWVADDDVYLADRFRRLKLAQLRDLAFDAESAVNRGRERAEYAHFHGSLSAYGGMVDAVKSITTDAARDYARQYLGRERARAVLVQPLADDARAPSPVPAAQDLASIVAHTPLSTDASKQLGRVHHLTGLHTAKLPNGLDLVLLRRPGAPVITASLAFHGGHSAAAPGVAAAANEALEITVEEAPGDFGIAFRTWLEDDLFTERVQAGADNLPRALDMLAFATRGLDLEWPSDKFRETKLPFLRRRESTAAERGARALAAALYRGHPFGKLPTADQIASPRKADLAAWLGRTVAPSNAVLVIVGDVDPVEAEAEARDSFASWRGGSGAIPPPAVARPSALAGGLAPDLDWSRTAIVTHRPGATQADLQLGCLLPPADAHGAAVYDIAAGIVEGNLWERLREQSGSTYGVHVWHTVSRGGTATLRIAADIDNGRFPLAVTTFRDLVSRMARTGVSPTAVQEGRDVRVRRHLLRYETSGALARALVDRWNLGWPLTSLDDEPVHFASVEKSEVDAALAVCARNLVVAVTGDQAMIRRALAPPPPPPPLPPTSSPPPTPASPSATAAPPPPTAP